MMQQFSHEALLRSHMGTGVKVPNQEDQEWSIPFVSNSHKWT